MDELFEKVPNQPVLKCEIDDVSFIHNPLSGPIRLEWTHGTLNFFSFAKDFVADQFGMGTEQVEIFSKHLYFAPSKIWDDPRATLDDV